MMMRSIPKASKSCTNRTKRIAIIKIIDMGSDWSLTHQLFLLVTVQRFQFNYLYSHCCLIIVLGSWNRLVESSFSSWKNVHLLMHTVKYVFVGPTFECSWVCRFKFKNDHFPSHKNSISLACEVSMFWKWVDLRAHLVTDNISMATRQKWLNFVMTARGNQNTVLMFDEVWMGFNNEHNIHRVSLQFNKTITKAIEKISQSNFQTIRRSIVLRDCQSF